jgi:Domain of unknown function (DUF4258)
MECSSVLFSRHALQRMFERCITIDEVLAVLKTGAVIEDYPFDSPYPSQLLLGFRNGRPLHVLAAREPATGQCVIVTCYVPDPALWGADFKTRKTP